MQEIKGKKRIQKRKEKRKIGLRRWWAKGENKKEFRKRKKNGTDWERKER